MDKSGKQSLYPDGDPDRHQNLTFVHRPIANPPRKFHANPFGSFWTKLLTDRQADKQTDTDENITSLVEVNNTTCLKNGDFVIENLAQKCRAKQLAQLAMYLASLHAVTHYTRMWANAQRDGRPAKHRWRPLFNAAKFG